MCLAFDRVVRFGLQFWTAVYVGETRTGPEPGPGPAPSPDPDPDPDLPRGAPGVPRPKLCRQPCPVIEGRLGHLPRVRPVSRGLSSAVSRVRSSTGDSDSGDGRA